MPVAAAKRAQPAAMPANQRAASQRHSQQAASNRDPKAMAQARAAHLKANQFGAGRMPALVADRQGSATECAGLGFHLEGLWIFSCDVGTT
jgi:hypothetical protein